MRNYKLFIIIVFILALLAVYLQAPGEDSQDRVIRTTSNICTYDKSLIIDDHKRTYRLYVPVSYRKNKPVSLFLALHGRGGAGVDMEALTVEKFNNLADSANMIVVYPDGFDNDWNYLNESNKPDDVEFISRLITDLRREFLIDQDKVFVVGFSSGALMAMRLASELPQQVSGIATVGATLPVEIVHDWKREKPLMVFMINGTEDKFFPYDGGNFWKSNSESIKVLSVEKTLDFWKKLNLCSSGPEKFSITEKDINKTYVEGYIYKVADQARIQQFIIVGGGHNWPDGQVLPEDVFGKCNRDFITCWDIADFFLSSDENPIRLDRSI